MHALRTTATENKTPFSSDQDSRCVQEDMPPRAQAAVAWQYACRKCTSPDLLKRAIPRRDVGRLVNKQSVCLYVVRVHLAGRQHMVSVPQYQIATYDHPIRLRT